MAEFLLHSPDTPVPSLGMDYLDLLDCCNPGALPLEARPHRVKVVRHASAEWDLERLHALGFIDDYTCRQGQDHFGRADFVVAFMAEAGQRSRLLRVYRNLGGGSKMPPWPKGYPYPTMGLGRYWYRLEQMAGFEELEERLIVDWGAGTRSWHQWIKPRDVIELLPQGSVREFPGYLDFTLSYSELKRIVNHPAANRVWHRMLREVAGVYLILDGVTGNQYVGSAYGAAGILGRWRSYAKRPDGGNRELKALLSEDPERYLEFRYSILRTLPRTLTQREVIEVETLYKTKLGSRAFGLNGN